MKPSNTDLRDMFGRDLSPALNEAAKSRGVTVDALVRRIRKEYAAAFGARFVSSPFIQGECISEWLAVHNAA